MHQGILKSLKVSNKCWFSEIDSLISNSMCKDQLILIPGWPVYSVTACYWTQQSVRKRAVLGKISSPLKGGYSWISCFGNLTIFLTRHNSDLHQLRPMMIFLVLLSLLVVFRLWVIFRLVLITMSPLNPTPFLTQFSVHIDWQVFAPLLNLQNFSFVINRINCFSG